MFETSSDLKQFNFLPQRKDTKVCVENQSKNHCQSTFFASLLIKFTKKKRFSIVHDEQSLRDKPK